MSRAQAEFLSFNRGLISPKALARVDIDRTRLSAERFVNFIPKTTGALTIRPGTKWLGSSVNDTGAEFLEFVASTDDVALVELTHNKMRMWLGTAAHALSLLSRPKVDTTVSLTDTGWSNTSIGGAFSIAASFDVLPKMTGPTTSGVTITGFPEDAIYLGSPVGERPGWKVGDDDLVSGWQDTGDGFNHIASVGPSQLRIDFGSDTGNRKAITAYSMRAVWSPAALQHAPRKWSLLSSNWDTGTYNTDTGKWALQDTQGSETGWAVSERRRYTTNIGDTGTVEPKRHWRLYFYESDGGASMIIVAEIEMFLAAAAQQVRHQGGRSVFNATSLGAMARAKKRVMIKEKL
jgi:hypothetical protein